MGIKTIQTGFWAGAFFAAYVCFSAGSGQAAPRLRYHVTEIGTLGGPATAFPVAINNHGVVVGKAPGSNYVDRPFVWKDGVSRDLGIGRGEFSGGIALDINDAGEIVATATVENFEHGYLVRATESIDLNVQTGERIYPTAINNQGLVVGFVPRGFNTLAISWSNGVLRMLGELETGGGSLAYDVNSWGDILVRAPLSSAPEDSIFSVVVRDGQWNFINGIGGLFMNDRGDIAGGTGGVIHAALYRNGTVLDLGALDDDIWSWPHGMNNFGEVVGYSDDRSETPRAFVYTDGEMQDLNTLVGPRSGWNFWVANAINDRGQIVGVGNYKGRESGFLLTPIGNARKR
jgi:probable HAF family extracellular repeat protein